MLPPPDAGCKVGGDYIPDVHVGSGVMPPSRPGRSGVPRRRTRESVGINCTERPELDLDTRTVFWGVGVGSGANAIQSTTMDAGVADLVTGLTTGAGMADTAADAIPEPATLSLLLGLVAIRRRKK